MSATYSVVTATEPIVKTTREEIALGVDFKRLLPSAVSVSSVANVEFETIEAGDEDDGSTLDVGEAGDASVNGTVVSVDVTGGHDGATYVVRIAVNRSDGAVREAAARVVVANY